jgi:hypothetical protein
LEEERWQSAHSELKHALDRLTEESATREKLQSLAYEVKFHLALKNANTLREDKDFAEAAKKYAEAKNLLDHIGYSQVLALTVEDPSHESEVCERLARTEGRLIEFKKQLPALVESEDYGKAREAYEQALPLTRGEKAAREELDSMFAPVPYLEALHKARQRDAVTAEMVRQYQQLLNRFPKHSELRSVIGRVAANLLPQLKQQAKAARRPKEIDSALRLGQALLALMDSAKLREFASEYIDCQGIVRDMEGKRDLQQELLGKVRTGDVEERRDAIQGAREENLELYDEADYSLEQLNAKILEQSERERFKQNVQDYKSFRERSEQAQEYFQEFNEQYAEAKKTAQEIEKLLAPEKREDIRRQLSSLESLVVQAKDYKSTQDQLPDENELAGQLENRARLMKLASLQDYLNATTQDLRFFRLDHVQYHLGRAKQAISDIPGAAAAYQVEIDTLEEEYWALDKLSRDDKSNLRSWRSILEEGQKLSREEKYNLGGIQRRASKSIFISELVRLAQLEGEPVTPTWVTAQQYDERCAYTHRELMRLLGEKQLYPLESGLNDFDLKWNRKLQNLDNSLWARHSEFVSAWHRRLAQARVIEDHIRGLYKFLEGLKPYTNIEWNISIEIRLYSIELLISLISPEVLSVYSEECKRVVQILLRKLVIDPGRIEEIIERQADSGRRFFGPFPMAKNVSEGGE